MEKSDLDAIKILLDADKEMNRLLSVPCLWGSINQKESECKTGKCLQCAPVKSLIVVQQLRIGRIIAYLRNGHYKHTKNRTYRSNRKESL